MHFFIIINKIRYDFLTSEILLTQISPSSIQYDTLIFMFLEVSRLVNALTSLTRKQSYRYHSCCVCNTAIHFKSFIILKSVFTVYAFWVSTEVSRLPSLGKRSNPRGVQSRFRVIYVYMYVCMYSCLRLSMGKQYKKIVCQNAWVEFRSPNTRVFKKQFWDFETKCRLELQLGILNCTFIRPVKTDL